MSNNCFLDLQRAATALYLNPSGKTHLVFLAHAQKIADKEVSTTVAKLQEVASRSLSVEDAALLADKILTVGIMQKEVRLTS